jgi:hypothetical protein
LLVTGEIAFFPQQVIIKSFGFGLIFCYFLAVQSPVANVFLPFQDLERRGVAKQVSAGNANVDRIYCARYFCVRKCRVRKQ